MGSPKAVSGRSKARKFCCPLASPHLATPQPTSTRRLLEPRCRETLDPGIRKRPLASALPLRPLARQATPSKPAPARCLLDLGLNACTRALTCPDLSPFVKACEISVNNQFRPAKQPRLVPLDCAALPAKCDVRGSIRPASPPSGATV